LLEIITGTPQGGALWWPVCRVCEQLRRFVPCALGHERSAENTFLPGVARESWIFPEKTPICGEPATRCPTTV